MKTTTVEIEDQKYELRKMRPVTGSYLWQKLTAACFKAQEQAVITELPDEAAKAKAVADANALLPEARMRGLCALAFMFLPFTDYEFALAACMKAASRYNDAGLPMPLMADSGQWAAGTEDLQENPYLVTRIMTEALAFNLSPYLAARTTPQQTLPTTA